MSKFVCQFPVSILVIFIIIPPGGEMGTDHNTQQNLNVFKLLQTVIFQPFKYTFVIAIMHNTYCYFHINVIDLQYVSTLKFSVNIAT